MGQALQANKGRIINTLDVTIDKVELAQALHVRLVAKFALPAEAGAYHGEGTRARVEDIWQAGRPKTHLVQLGPAKVTAEAIAVIRGQREHGGRLYLGPRTVLAIEWAPQGVVGHHGVVKLPQAVRSTHVPQNKDMAAVWATQIFPVGFWQSGEITGDTHRHSVTAALERRVLVVVFPCADISWIHIAIFKWYKE
jgi:hypothetical protein